MKAKKETKKRLAIENRIEIWVCLHNHLALNQIAIRLKKSESSIGEFTYRNSQPTAAELLRFRY